MDWSNERYVRVYTRDTTTWKLMDWRGRCVLQLLMRKVDRAGVLDVGHDGVLGLAAVLELPLELVEAGIAQLTTSRGGLPTVVDTGTAYVLPNFIEAQEAPSSDPQRKRESRARRRDRSLAASRNLLLTDSARQDEPSGHETGHEQDDNAEPVTPIRSVPSRSDPDQNLSLAGAHAIPPSTEPSTTPTPNVPAKSPQATDRGDNARTHEPLGLDPRSRGDLALATWRRLSDLRVEHAAKLRLIGVLPFPPIAPSSNPRGYRELADRIREEGDAAREVCDHVLRVLDQQATDSKDLEWLAEKAFLAGPWEKARNTPLAKRKPPVAAPSTPAPIAPADLAGTADLAAAWEVLGIAKEPA